MSDNEHELVEGLPAGLDLGALMGMAQNMQAQLAESQDLLANTIVEGKSGGGAVVVAVTGSFQFQQVRIDPVVLESFDVALIEDLVLAALLDATSRVEELQAGANPLGGLLGGF